MKFIAIDLELDQPSDSIIQIGATAFDTTAKSHLPTKVQNFSQYVETDTPSGIPNWSHPLSGHNNSSLGELLGPEFIELHATTAVEKKKALEGFWMWLKTIGYGKKLVQWGSGDLACIREECYKYNVEIPKGIRCLNVKLVYQMLFQTAHGLKNKSGLSSVIKEFLNMDFMGRPHNALDDAYNTGLVFLKMFKEISAVRKFNNEFEFNI